MLNKLTVLTIMQNISWNWKVSLTVYALRKYGRIILLQQEDTIEKAKGNSMPTPKDSWKC